jgi:hypothetical protein
MTGTEKSRTEQKPADPRRAFWLQQYATAYASGDKRSAAMALQFLQAGAPGLKRGAGQQK